MKIVIKEWLKAPRAVLIMLVTIAVAGVKSWAAVQTSVYIPKVITEGVLNSPAMWWLIFVSVLAVVMDTAYSVMESKSYRIFYTTTVTRFTRAILDARYELYTKYSNAHIMYCQDFVQDSSTVGKCCIRISSNVIHMVLNAGAIIILAPEVLLPISAMYAVMVVLVLPLYKKIGFYDRESKDTMKQRNQVLENTVYGFSEVRTNCTQEYEYDRVKKMNWKIYNLLNVKNRWIGSLMFAASGMDGLGTIVAMIYVIRLIAAGTISAATGISVVTMAGSLLGGLMNILDLVDTCSEVTSRADSWEAVMRDASVPQWPGSIEMVPLQDSIEIKDVKFAYGDTGSVLNGCSMSIKAGTKIGICGKSGDGKSTLLKLLCKFYEPDKGSIKVDGVDLYEIRANSFYDQVSVVSQEITIFPGSILENIRYGRPDVTEHAVIEACKKAELYDFVMKLPQQLQTEVGPRGMKLSGGQRQRVALARMFLKDPSIIILDEATSALDNNSEKAIQRVIEKMEGKTIIMVAHRLSTIENCDQIFVMENGQIVERGTSKELEAMNGIYSKMLHAAAEEE